ncbi:hypothetical protein H4S06_003668 [Coemansia sp. BCRC 34490]|nr:hypothetical protein H4S06_003668 [Coemansia sp. BCRC 34490]
MTEDVINVKTNPLSIGCPRAGCKCTIIRPGAATLVRRSSSSSSSSSGESQASPAAADGGASVTDGNNGGGSSALPGIGAPDIKLSSIDNVPSQIANLFTQPSSSTTADAMDGWFWMLTDMMDFENVGFSHSVGSVKYLSCADCDLAPLGYHDTEQAKTGAKEFLIAADRAVYR